MDRGAIPGVHIIARDGDNLSVSAEGVRIGERRFPIERIQDARQVSPDPETIALRVAGFPMVEFRPAQQGDARLALEAIYRLRPDLRPVGFEAPKTLPPGFPPLPVPVLYPPQYPGYAPVPSTEGAYAPPRSPGAPSAGYFGAARPTFPPPQGRYLPYPGTISPNRLTGELTRYPRSYSEILGAVFQLFGKYASTWLRLGLLVGFLPGALGGAILLVIGDTQRGWAGTVASANSTLCTFPVFTLPPPDQLARDAALFVGLLVLAAIASAYAAATLGFAAHEALLGRPPQVGASLRGGFQRFRAVLGTTSVLLFTLCALLLPGFVCFEVSLPALSGVDLCVNTAVLSSQTMTGLSLYVLGAGLLLAGGFTCIFLLVRLAGAPYLAATQQMATRAALTQSWRLTRGFYWKTLGLSLVLWLTLYLLGAVLGILTLAISDPIESLIVLPLAQIVAAPLYALLWTTQMLDLRLRREGYDGLRGQTDSRTEAFESSERIQT